MVSVVAVVTVATYVKVIVAIAMFVVAVATIVVALVAGVVELHNSTKVSPVSLNPSPFASSWHALDFLF